MKKQLAIEEICKAGITIEHVIHLPGGNTSGKKRAKKSKETAETVQKFNDLNAERSLRRLINHNFGDGDGHYTLTYSEAPSQEEAHRDLGNFIKRLRRRFAKQGKELKYIAVTEYHHKRIHHHIIINTDDARLVNKTWGKGFVKLALLDESGDYALLANYLIKETQKTFREDNIRKRRFSASTNLIRPEVKKKRTSAGRLYQDPTPRKGYQIIQDSVQIYENPYTGTQTLEYREIRINQKE